MCATPITVVAVSLSTIRKAETEILSCMSCDRTSDIPFRRVLDWITDRGQFPTHYLMSEPAACPRCRADVFEDTLVEWKR